MGFAFSGMITVIGTIRRNAMNARIKELAEQAGIYKLDLSDETEYWIVEKFAQLIVEECMNVLDPGEHQLIARFQARKWLAEHFGVTE